MSNNIQQQLRQYFANLKLRIGHIHFLLHNAWVDGNAPMFTAYQDRIEIESMGTLPPKQTKEGFFRGRSIPVNLKLSEIFVQLHISEKSGRGVPRIVGTYGRDVFKFTDSSISIIVTIPFNRLDLGDIPQVTPQVTPQVISTYSLDNNETVTGRILSFCSEAKSLQEILAHLGLKDRKNLMTYIRALVESGRLARTIPDKPNSRNQKYITIK